MNSPSQNSEILAAAVEHCQKNPPSQFLSYRKFFESLANSAKQQKVCRSMHSLSEALGFGNTTYLHLICNGHRRLSPEKAALFATKCLTTRWERRYFKFLVAYNNESDPAKRETWLLKMMQEKDSNSQGSQAALWDEYLSSWTLPLIKELACLYTKDSLDLAPNHLHLELKPSEWQKGLDLLQRLGIISFDEKLGRFIANEEILSTGSRASGIRMRKYQVEMLDQSKNALSAIPGKDRDFSFVTVKASRDDLKAIKSKIHELQNWILELGRQRQGTSPDDSQIFQVNMQLFPYLKDNRQTISGAKNSSKKARK